MDEPMPTCPWCNQTPTREGNHTSCMNFRCHFYKTWVPDGVWNDQRGVTAAVEKVKEIERIAWKVVKSAVVADAVAAEREQCCKDMCKWCRINAPIDKRNYHTEVEDRATGTGWQHLCEAAVIRAGGKAE